VSRVRITYRKSAIGYPRDQRATLTALGLRKLHQTVEHDATPAIRGMVQKVRHLVSVDGRPADAVRVPVAESASSNADAGAEVAP